MGFSQLATKCKKCPEVDTCDHKEMEAVSEFTFNGESSAYYGVATGGGALMSNTPIRNNIIDVTVADVGLEINLNEMQKMIKKSIGTPMLFS